MFALRPRVLSSLNVNRYLLITNLENLQIGLHKLFNTKTGFTSAVRVHITSSIVLKNYSQN